jgi:hypothetical protein
MQTIDSAKEERIHSGFSYAATLCIIIGLCLRIVAMCNSTLWADEAESCINALTILESGVPVSTYQGQPIFENTLLKPAPDDPEYEFLDISYSEKGLAVYHGWLPLYSIALAQAIGGISPDKASDTPVLIHGAEDVFFRTVVPRIPSVIFSITFLITLYLLLRRIANEPAALIALVFLCFNQHAIKYGVEARYYSLTLCLSAFCASAAYMLYKYGRWRDYLLLGLCEGLLFHTHQLSSLIFALSCFLLIPRILRHENWVLKSASAASFSALLTIPWAYYTGFFSAASGIPKAHELFSSRLDWIRYLIERPTPLAIVGSLVVLLIVTLILNNRGVVWIRDVPKRLKIYTFCIIWSLTAYCAFQLLVPAASYFFERLTLIILVPTIAFLGMVIAEVINFKSQRTQIIASISIPLLLLGIVSDLPKLDKSLSPDTQSLSEVFNVIEKLDPTAPIRIYATPNHHLPLAYYTGLPIQSIAPIRKSYLSHHQGPLLFFEGSWIHTEPDSAQIIKASREIGIELNEPQLEASIALIRLHMIGAQLNTRGLPQWRRSTPALPDHYQAPLEHALEMNDTADERSRNWISYNPIFRNLNTNNMRDHWMCFFYRFVDFQSRIGLRSNIRPIMESAEIKILPKSGFVAYYKPNSKSIETQ